ncbi:MAG TPA: hypothetical protein VN771_03355 [Candidatus Baltobacteraceae bacterium]|nr:hypothetical protein [Candidatus Baltobacteraceae bacterium]
MPQIHLRAEPGDYAPLVLLPGDPNRATRIAERFDGGLEAARRVTDHRAMYGYTGTYQGHPVSVQTTGMGTPSISIVVEELLRLGATRTYLHGEPYAPVADFDLTRALVDEARRRGIRTHVGPVATVDVFYNPDDDYVSRWRARGILGFEMEAAALFFLAARAAAAGADVRAACALTVSDVLSEETTSEASYMSLEDLAAATDRMIEVALTAGVAV